MRFSAEGDIIGDASGDGRFAVARLGRAVAGGRFRGRAFADVLRAFFAMSEEFGGDLRKHGEGQHVFIGTVAAFQAPWPEHKVDPIRV